MEIYLNWNLGAPANLATLLRTPLQLEKPAGKPGVMVWTLPSP